MLKEAIYFEDLQKTVFVIKVKDGEREWLERREWHKNDYEYTPDDDFTRLKDSGASRTELYEWISVRSTLQAVSPDAAQWMDRNWVVAA